MSEEILKALMQLFAILAKQDAGLSTNEREYVQLFLKQQLNESSVKEYIALFDSFIGKSKDSGDEDDKPKLTSVRDSVKILGICKKINKTLTQKQKVVVLVRLFELINSDKKFTPQRIAIIDTAAEVFNITKDEYKAIEKFVITNNLEEVDSADIMVVSASKDKVNPLCKYIESQVEGNVFILKVNSVDLYFIRYDGEEELLLNGLLISNQRIYLFANGSVVKLPKSKPIFYSDVAAKFLADSSFINIKFQTHDLGFKFPNGNIGLTSINISENSGKLVGIMGASGAGKTTLLNVLSGIDSPTSGEVLINGVNLHQGKDKIKGIIGYIPQDDLLIEELTVYENLYYNAKLIFKDLSEEIINERVLKVLNSLGLTHIKDLKVGSPLNKKISGGQRKRLNIGLELIREPAVLFVDEPTSGLSSRDSENVMELLRELTLKGKLIFVVIHQPSSDIYKMFDNVIIIDVGGRQIYYGNPVEAVIYFKQLDNQINSNVGECPKCGNVNPETIFSIIEARIVDEYGKPTGKRKVAATEWADIYEERRTALKENQTFDALPESVKMPSWFKQVKIYFTRDLFSKLANTQYVAISLLEAPLIGFLLAFTLRYIADPNSDLYIFRENENIMPYVFMCTIVALFIGLIVSAEEIFKDRKILKREAFLNLSRSSYLSAKISILFILSALQALLFVLVSNTLLGVKGMYFDYWVYFFSVAAFANMLGLNISSAFNSAVTIYILIPFLIIPQMVLTGAMFPYDKINKFLGGGSEKVPLIADVMPSRWAFEALVVNQYMNNEYEKKFYDLDKKISIADFKNVHYIPELKGILDKYRVNHANKVTPAISDENIDLLYNEIKSELKKVKSIKFNDVEKIKPETFNDELAVSIQNYLDELKTYYRDRFNASNQKKEDILNSYQKDSITKRDFQILKNTYDNKVLGDYVTNKSAYKSLIRDENNRFVQKIDPVYLDPQNTSFLSYRTHFLAPKKPFMGMLFSTFSFNLAVLWIFTLLLYIALYYEWLKKALETPDRYKLFKQRHPKLFGNINKFFNKINFFKYIKFNKKIIVESVEKVNKN